MSGLTPERLAATQTGLRRARALIDAGGNAVSEYFAALDEPDRRAVNDLYSELVARGIGLLFLGDAHYPASLRRIKSPPPFLFFKGDIGILRQASVGMCGSRAATDRGLDAARACAEEAAGLGRSVISGYARGVDTEAHIAALRAGSATIIVLAEGILHFRRKKAFADLPFDEAHVLAVSQFPVRQRWSVGGAMSRNSVIAGLGQALIVIEAGDTGGTLAAGVDSLKRGWPVFTLDFSDDTPGGNRQLIESGAAPIRTRRELRNLLAQMGNGGPTTVPRAGGQLF